MGRGALFGLSKERPILGDHPKAHIHEIRPISGEIRRISCRFHLKSAGFHADFVRISPAEIRRISKDQLPGMVSPMLQICLITTGDGSAALAHGSPSIHHVICARSGNQYAAFI